MPLLLMLPLLMLLPSADTLLLLVLLLMLLLMLFLNRGPMLQRNIEISRENPRRRWVNKESRPRSSGKASGSEHTTASCTAQHECALITETFRHRLVAAGRPSPAPALSPSPSRRHPHPYHRFRSRRLTGFLRKWTLRPGGNDEAVE